MGAWRGLGVASVGCARVRHAGRCAPFGGCGSKPGPLPQNRPLTGYGAARLVVAATPVGTPLERLLKKGLDSPRLSPILPEGVTLKDCLAASLVVIGHTKTTPLIGHFVRRKGKMNKNSTLSVGARQMVKSITHLLNKHSIKTVHRDNEVKRLGGVSYKKHDSADTHNKQGTDQTN